MLPTPPMIERDLSVSVETPRGDDDAENSSRNTPVKRTFSWQRGHRQTKQAAADAAFAARGRGLEGAAPTLMAHLPPATLAALAQVRPHTARGSSQCVNHQGSSHRCVACARDAQALRLIATAEFDTVLFPLNFAAVTVGGVGLRVLTAAKAAGMGVLAIKARRAPPQPGVMAS